MHHRHPLAAAIIAAAVTPLSVVAVEPLSVAANASEETVLAPVKVQEKSLRDEYSPAQSSVGAKTPALIRDIPQTVNVINRAVLDAQQATSLKDALRYVPGITLSAGEGGQIGDNINLRGYNARTDVYVDGFRDRGQYSRDTFYLDAVEVLKGPSSMLFGRGSTGGVVNQSSKKADLKARGEVSLSLGTDDYYRTAIDINEPLSDGAAFRLAAFAQDVQTTRDVVHNKDFGFAPSLRLGIGSDTELNFSALIQRNNDIPDYGFPLLRSDNTANSVAKPAAAPAHNFYGYLDDHYDQDVNVLTADVKHRLSDTFSINSRTQYSQYRVTASPSPLSAAKTLSGGTPYLDTPLGEIVASRQDKDRTIDDYSLSNQTDVIAKLRSGSIQHTLTSGFELGIDHYLNNYYTWDTSSDDRLINLAYPVNGTREGTRYRSRNTDVTATTVAAYANDQIDLTSEWKLIVGLRWDRFDTDAQQLGYLADGGIDTSSSSRGPASYDAARVDTMVSKRLGLIWQPTESQSYYVAYGTSFNPSAEAVALSAADEDVAPEKNESYEIGAKYDLLEGNLQLNAALFQIEKTNAQTNDPISGALTLDGDTRVRGFEINAVGHLTPNWQILAGYTRLDGEVVDSYDSTTLTTDAGTATVYAKGKTLQNTPENNVTLWTTYTVFDVWEIGGGMLYVDDRYVNNYETAMVDGYTRYDATLAYRQPKFDVRLNLQNLTDKTYFDVASGGRATPANGRTLILTTTYRF